MGNNENYDYINPKHYSLWDNKEAIDVLEDVLTAEEFRGYLKGNILKYKLRLGSKPNESVDKEMQKIKWYQHKLKEFDNLPF